MSGGDKKTTKKTDTATTQPMQTVQPGMPGQIDALSQQLAAGFGQRPGDVMAQLLQYYQPMSLPNYAPAAPTTPAPKPTTTPVVKPAPTQWTPPASTSGLGLFGNGSTRSGGSNR